MRSDPAPSNGTEFLVEPLACPGVGILSPEAAFCDGCSGCSVRASRLIGVIAGEGNAGDDDFLVELLPLPSTGTQTPEIWCAGCKGCSGACRSLSH